MARLAISRDYFPAYARLPRKAQRKADEFLRKFEQDSTAASIHLEPIYRTLDPQLRSARIGDDYRVILRAPEQGDVFLVLWADHHDEAYRWAVTKQTAVHPATGSLQIFDVTEAVEAVTTKLEPASWEKDAAARLAKAVDNDPADLFADRSDDELFLAGVPRALLPSVRALVSDADLDRLLPHLPPEAGEVLTALAAGISLDDALEEVLGRMAPPPVAPPPVAPTAPAVPAIDVTDFAAALERDTTQRQFHLIANSLDLDAALKHPLDIWRVFLHPRQRRIAHAHTKGPTRVLGGAGTGKTVVALHRAAYLVREVFKKPDDRVLFTTFTVNLARDLKVQLGKLLEPDQLARVEVVNIDAWALAYLRGRGISVRPAYDARDQREHFDAAYEVYGHDDVAVEFYRAEWQQVIQEQGLRTEEEYVRAVRTSRGIPLDRTQRRRLWPVFAAYRDNLEAAGLTEPRDILRRALAEVLAAGDAPRYRSVVVDEVQDFSADALRLLRAIAGPERPDDLFLVGDAHQRIYGRAVALSHCGIQVRGRRSQTLRINYRTTGAICRWSMAILKDVAVDDLDDGVADRRGHVSLREGPVPRVHACSSANDEERAVVETVKAYAEAGTPLEAICVVARTKDPLRDRIGPALERAGVASVLLEQEEPRLPGVRMATMHRVKGLEFAVVLLVGISKHAVPFSSPELRSDDPVMRAQALLLERSLLYVAASRARDAMHVFFHGEPSPLLAIATSVVAAAPHDAAAQVGPTSERPPRLATRPQASPIAPVATESDAPTGATSPAVASIDPRVAALFGRPLELFDFPMRLLNWAKRSGVATFGELVAVAPVELLDQGNMGRKTLADTREVIERVAGQRWEDLQREPVGASILDGEADGSASTQAGATWDVMRRHLSESERAIELARLPLPARIETYVGAHGLQTLGELAAVSRAELLEAPRLGPLSVEQLPDVIRAYIDATRNAAALVEGGLLECFERVMETLEPVQRIVTARRAGLGSQALTLREIGDMFGKTREWVRLNEKEVGRILGNQPWAAAARARIQGATAGGAVMLRTLATDPWWAAASAQPEVLDFVVEHVLAMDLRVIEFGGDSWLSPHREDVVAKAYADVLAKAKAQTLPTPLTTMRALVTPHAATFGDALCEALFDELRARLKIDAGEDEASARVVAIGNTLAARAIEILHAAGAPMAPDELFRQLGARMGALPDEVVYFRRGLIGLREHFPDFDAWRSKLVPAAVKVVETQGPDRQWYCTELRDELREEFDIPDWLTAWGLAALIKDTSELNYLGRLRVALPGSVDDERRIQVHELIEKLLKQAGEPMPRGELVAQIENTIGKSTHIQLTFNRPQFVRLEGDRVGLLARDVPGGAAAIAEAAAHVEGVLARREKGLADVYVHDEVAGLSPQHATWSLPLTMSVLRSDGRFRMAMSGAVGLAIWESTRVPTRFELVRGALDDAGDRVSVEAVQARVAAHYGEPLSRPSLISIAYNAGAGMDGEWLVRKAKP